MAGPTLRLNLDAMGVKQGARDVNAAFDKIKQGAQQTEVQVKKTGSAIERMGKMSGQQRFIFQNTANQLGDIAVQASMGTNIFRVLGQQIPQIAGGFALLGGAMGPIAAVLSVVAAVGFPLIAMFTNLGGATDGLDEKLDKLADTTDRLTELNDQLSLSKEELIEKYGRGAIAATELGIAMARVAYGRAKDDVTALVKEVGKLADEMSNATFYDPFSESLNDLRVEFGLTVEETMALQKAFSEFGRAKGIEDLTEKGRSIIRMLDNMGVKLEDVKDDALRDFVDGLGSMAEQARLTAEQQERLNELLEEYKKLKLEVNEVAPPDITDIFDPRTTSATDLLRMRASASKEMQEAIDAFLQGDSALPKSKKSDAQKKFDAELKAEQARLRGIAKQYKPAVDAATEYQRVISDINKAVEIKAISEQEGAIATAEATRRYQIAIGELADYDAVANTFARGLENSMLALVDGTMSVQDAFKSMASAVIKELFRVLVVQQMVNAAMGVFGYSPAAGGGYVKTDVGAYGGQAYAGNAMIVGEKGPELFIPQTGGQIVPNSGMGGDVIVQQTINVQTGVQQTVRNEIRNMLPMIAESTKGAVLDAKRRGGSYGKAFA